MQTKPDAYWSERYKAGDTGWDIGYPTPAIVRYFQKKKDYKARILIPGCGNAYEAEALLEIGYQNITLVDIAEALTSKLKEKFKDQPGVTVLHQNFFELDKLYYYIIEQTFFCAIARDLRKAYVKKAKELLEDGGVLVGLLWKKEFEAEGPPYGGSEEEYRQLFEPKFNILRLETAIDSIEPRNGTELFIEVQSTPSFEQEQD